MNPVQLLTLKRGVLVRLINTVHKDEDFNVTVTHLVGYCVNSQRDAKGKEMRVTFRASEVAWDKDRPTFYKLGRANGLCGPNDTAYTDISLAPDAIASMQLLDK